MEEQTTRRFSNFETIELILDEALRVVKFVESHLVFMKSHLKSLIFQQRRLNNPDLREQDVRIT